MCFSTPSVPQVQPAQVAPPPPPPPVQQNTPKVENGETQAANAGAAAQVQNSQDPNVNNSQNAARKRSLFQIDLTIPTAGASTGVSGVQSTLAQQTGASYN